MVVRAFCRLLRITSTTCGTSTPIRMVSQVVIPLILQICTAPQRRALQAPQFARSSLSRFLSINEHCHPRTSVARSGDPVFITPNGQGASLTHPLPIFYIPFFLLARRPSSPSHLHPSNKTCLPKKLLDKICHI